MKESFHFLGAGGSGMSALAHILLEKGHCVSGTDLVRTDFLETLGMKRLDLFPQEGTIVYSSAIPPDHSVLLRAKEEKWPILHRSELLSLLLKGKRGILIAGTHGKTMTGALLTWTLFSAGLDPTFAVGGTLQNLKKNGGAGAGKWFVLEADESDGSFLNYSGEGAIVTSIEKDHLAFWKSEENLVRGFQSFLAKVKNKESLFWCKDDPCLAKMEPPGISYGKEGALKLVSCKQRGEESFFSAQFERHLYRDIQVPLMGEKLPLNALAVFGMALKLKIPEASIRKAFATFRGVKRRHEKLGQAKRITIYDDYAHHPTAIEALLKSLKKRGVTGRLIALFQPHRFSRTQELLFDFKGAFDAADLSIMTSIYPAGEAPIPGISGKTLFHHANTGNMLFLEKKDLLNYLPKMLLPGDVLAIIGAGDVTEVGPKLLQSLA